MSLKWGPGSRRWTWHSGTVRNDHQRCFTDSWSTCYLWCKGSKNLTRVLEHAPQMVCPPHEAVTQLITSLPTQRPHSYVTFHLVFYSNFFCECLISQRYSKPLKDRATFVTWFYSSAAFVIVDLVKKIFLLRSSIRGVPSDGVMGKHWVAICDNVDRATSGVDLMLHSSWESAWFTFVVSRPETKASRQVTYEWGAIPPQNAL